MTIGPDSILVKKVQERFALSILDTLIVRNEITYLIKKDSLIDICRFLKDDFELQLNFL